VRTGLVFIPSWLRVAIFVAGAVLAAAPSAAQDQASPNAMATQTSSDRGVTLKVTPKSIASSGNRWEFSIVLDTHSADLVDDLTQSATLTTGDGRTFKPVSWLGAAPGGHHREGVLAFDVLAPGPGAIELRIDRPGEPAPRTFRWQL
jgi:hypothetical protein